MNDGAAPVVQVRDLWAGYDKHPVLEGIGLSVQPRDYVGIIGPNGGGKTTLLRVLLGLLKPLGGAVTLFGGSVEAGRHRIGYVPQVLEFDREFPIRARDVVRMGRLGGRGKLFARVSRQDEAQVERAMEQTGVADLGDELFGDLSGGQRQRVLLSRALAVEPELLLLDEPTSSVDPRIQGNIYELLGQLNETVTILLVTHDISVVSRHVKTVACLNRTLHYHGGTSIPEGLLEETYGCPIDLIAHGTPHRVFAEHDHGAGPCAH